jgi:hypothetical protein
MSDEQPSLGNDSREDNDGRQLYDTRTKYTADDTRQHLIEGIYIGVLLLFSILAISTGTLGLIERLVGCLGVDMTTQDLAKHYFLVAASGLLGGTVYGAKWLYHAVAKGLWHQDRRLWRYLSPWISLGTTIGVWALIEVGFFNEVVPVDGSGAASVSTKTAIGAGFVIGYLSDQFLAKMKELTEVLFGQVERHFGPRKH